MGTAPPNNKLSASTSIGTGPASAPASSTANADGPVVLEQQPLRQKKSERAERLCDHPFDQGDQVCSLARRCDENPAG
jgi:hypothetical protein